MSKDNKQLSDPLIDEVRERHRRLVREHGGLRGWVAHLHQEQEKRPGKLVPPKTRTVPRS